MRWVLLIRAVNVGGKNTLPMKDLKDALEDLGHTEVKTYLNTGNATFTSSSRSAPRLAAEISSALLDRLALDVRCCVRSSAELEKALEELPDLPGYVVVNVLFDRPSASSLQAFLDTDWAPEVVQGNDQVLYLGFENAGRTKLTQVKIEKALGVSGTARTPATLRKLLG